jgi:hypothetical protein
MPLKTEQEEALKMFLQLEDDLRQRDQVKFAQKQFIAHDAELPPKLKECREKAWVMLVRIRDEMDDSYFQDKLVFSLCIAYMDRVFACNPEEDSIISSLQRSAAMPLACMWLAIKVFLLKKSSCYDSCISDIYLTTVHGCGPYEQG